MGRTALILIPVVTIGIVAVVLLQRSERPPASAGTRGRGSEPDNRPDVSSDQTSVKTDGNERTSRGHTPVPLDPSDVRARFRAAQSWQERERILMEIPRAKLAEYQDLLLEVAEGDDVEALRGTAVERLEEMALVGRTTGWLARRFAARLEVEPRPVIRHGIVTSLGHLYLTDRRNNGWIFDVVVSRLAREEAPRVRANLAGVLGYFEYTDRERTLAALRNALQSERDPEAREVIEMTIRQIED